MDDPSKRATVYFDADLHQALRVKAAVSSRSISEIVNEAVRRSLAEDAEDLAAFEQRAREPRMNFETLVGSLRKRGKI
jgi:plasmid stability protein